MSNVEWTWGYRETDALGGKDPYSASKGAAELAIKTYAYSYFSGKDSLVKVAVGRAGNVIGGGDWALDRIVPDCVTSWSQGKNVEIRNPLATRPWQHVLEPLSGYLVIGQKLVELPSINTEAFNLGPDSKQNHTVAELIDDMSHHWDGVQWESVGDASSYKESTLLKLCCDKALHSLEWRATMNFKETVRFTVEWYRHYYENPPADIYDFTKQQIQDYTRLASEQDIAWTQ